MKTPVFSCIDQKKITSMQKCINHYRQCKNRLPVPWCERHCFCAEHKKCYYLIIFILREVKILALLLQEMISISIYACFQILLIFSLFIMLLYTYK